jgi:hypothetical protein
MCLVNFKSFQVCMPACLRLLIHVSGVYACYFGIQVCKPAIQVFRCVRLHTAGIQVCTPAFTGVQVCTSAYIGISCVRLLLQVGRVRTPAYIGLLIQVFRCVHLRIRCVHLIIQEFRYRHAYIGIQVCTPTYTQFRCVRLLLQAFRFLCTTD